LNQGSSTKRKKKGNKAFLKKEKGERRPPKKLSGIYESGREGECGEKGPAGKDQIHMERIQNGTASVKESPDDKSLEVGAA